MPNNNAAECFNCGSQSNLLFGLYEPPAMVRKLLGEPAGKTRRFAYFACEHCFTSSPVCQLVEEAVYRHLWSRHVN